MSVGIIGQNESFSEYFYPCDLLILDHLGRQLGPLGRVGALGTAWPKICDASCKHIYKPRLRLIFAEQVTSLSLDSFRYIIVSFVIASGLYHHDSTGLMAHYICK